MDVKRLFGVLVLGGAALGCDDVSPGVDAGVADLSVDAAMAGDMPPAADAGALDGGEELMEVFCPTDEACDGESVRPGFMCCWSTSC